MHIDFTYQAIDTPGVKRNRKLLIQVKDILCDRSRVERTHLATYVEMSKLCISKTSLVLQLSSIWPPARPVLRPA